MKNFINYYYNFNIEDLHFSNEKYFFSHEQKKYMLKICNNLDILAYYTELSSQLYQYDYFFIIIPNIDNHYITWIDNKPYVLFQLSNIINDKISIFDIRVDFFINLNSKISTLNRFPWIQLWENKIDYFEEWFSSKQDSYKNIYPLFHYFIGIAENALLYLKENEKEETKEQSDQLVISHNRLVQNYELFDYYDPTNIIVDHASRDVSEYIKSTFLNRVWDLDMMKDYLQKHYFSKYGLRVMYARILFPSFFFDYIEEMITNNRDIDLLYLENRADEFQTFIKEISLFLQEKYDLPIIPWIIKKI